MFGKVSISVVGESVLIREDNRIGCAARMCGKDLHFETNVVLLVVCLERYPGCRVGSWGHVPDFCSSWLVGLQFSCDW